MTKPNETMTAISNESIFEEAAARLREIYLRERGAPFLYGSFNFIFHDGKFQSIEERPRNRRYVSQPLRTSTGGFRV